MAHVQGNDPGWIGEIVARSGVRAHPADLGIATSEFSDALRGLAHYARAERLDFSVVDLHPLDAATIDAAWDFTCSLPRVRD